MVWIPAEETKPFPVPVWGFPGSVRLPGLCPNSQNFLSKSESGEWGLLLAGVSPFTGCNLQIRQKGFCCWTEILWVVLVS